MGEPDYLGVYGSAAQLMSLIKNWYTAPFLIGTASRNGLTESTPLVLL